MTRLVSRRIAGLGAFMLFASMVWFTVAGAAVAQVAGDYDPPDGCIKLEGRQIGTTETVELPDGLMVTFAWTPKDGERGEYIGFTWDNDEAYGTVKDGGPGGGSVYRWGPGLSGSFTVGHDENGRMHAISFVIVCEEPTEPEFGSITVIKGTVPRTAAEFDFEFSTLAGRSVEFGLAGMDDAATTGVVENQRVFDQLPPDTYVIEELLGDMPRGYVFVDVSCRGGEYREAGAKVGISLEAGDDYVCTFVNESEEEPEYGSITVIKGTVPRTAAEFDFEFSTLAGRSVEFGLAGMDDAATTGVVENQRVFDQLPPDTYVIEELLGEMPRGYVFVDVSCRGGEYREAGAKVGISLEAGDDYVCTFVNESEEEPEYGSITIIKETSPSTGAEFDFRLSVGERPLVFTLEGEDDPSTSTDVENRRVFDQLPSDTYVVEELLGDMPGRYSFRDVSCTGGDYDESDATVTMDLEAGDDYVCTFENRKRGGGNGGNGGDREGAIGDFVWFDTNGNGVQDSGEVPLEGVTVQLLDAPGKLILESMKTDSAGKYLFTGLDKGTYRVKFLLPDVYDNQTESFTKWSVGPVDKDSDADPTSAGMTAVVALSEGETDLTWDAGVIAAAVLGAEVQATTSTVAVLAAETLPFTGAGVVGLGMLGLMVTALGGLVLATTRAGRHS